MQIDGGAKRVGSRNPALPGASWSTAHPAGTLTLTLFFFCVPKMLSTAGDSDSGKGKRPVKRGKGQGGQKARYATQMTPAARAAQYPHKPFTVKQTDAGERLWCLCCGKPVSHQTKTYVGTEFRDISGPAHLLQWWEARPASPFKDRVLFLVCMVMGTSSVERFFSFCKYADTDQRYSTSNNARRVAFMAHYMVHCACYVLKLPIGCVIDQKKPFCKKSCAPLLLMSGIESGDQKEMYRNFYRNFTVIFRHFPQFHRNFFRLGGPQSPPPPQGCQP